MKWQLLAERRALSLLMQGFMTTLFLLVALSIGPEWMPCFAALAMVYGVGFFAQASEWFWARWYVTGVSATGVSMAALGLLTNGWNGGLAIYGGIHLAIWAPLLGEGQADRFENRPDWRERYGVDEHGAMRLKRAIKSTAAALPTLVFYTLAPREGQGLCSLQAVALLSLAVLGVIGLLRMRFWGVASLMVAAVGLGATVVGDLMSQTPAISSFVPLVDGPVCLAGVGMLAQGALMLAVSPFVLPAYRFLRTRP